MYVILTYMSSSSLCPSRPSGSILLPYRSFPLLIVRSFRRRLDELTDTGKANIRLIHGLTNRSIFVGTLEDGVKTGMHSVYGASESRPVQVHVFETNNDTVDDYQSHDHKESALVDIWLLSYAQTLILSPSSTYGYIAMALGNTETWVLDREPLDGCSKARSREPCYHVPPVGYDTELAEKAKSDGRLGFPSFLSGVVSMCNDQWGGLTFVTT